MTRLLGLPQAADPAPGIAPPPKVMVSLTLDADLLAHFQSETEPGNWRRHINDALRFYVETSQIAEADAEFVNEPPNDEREAALLEMTERHWREYDDVHGGSGRVEEMPSDLDRRHDEEWVAFERRYPALAPKP